jgi:ABC-type transporter Mla subunit MlaD
MKCDRCGKDVDPVYPHTCTPLALKLADQLLYSAVIDHHEAAAELRRLYEEVEGTTQRNRDIYKQLDQAEAEIDRLSAELERVAPGYATLHKQAEIRQQLTDLERQSLEDLQRLVETQRYDLDAMSAIKEERDTANALLLEAIGLLMQMPIKHPQQGEYREDLMRRIGEHIK